MGKQLYLADQDTRYEDGDCVERTLSIIENPRFLLEFHEGRITGNGFYYKIEKISKSEMRDIAVKAVEEEEKKELVRLKAKYEEPEEGNPVI